MLELRNFPKVAHYSVVDRGAVKLSESPAVSGRMSYVLQVLATVYAVAILVITVGVYTRNEQHPGPALFFVACLASFYIICYNALSIEVTFKSWLEQHYPALRTFSIAVAVVLAAVPIGILYLADSTRAAKAGPSAGPKVTAAVAATPTDAGNIPAPASVKTPAPISVVRDIRYLSDVNSITVAIDIGEKAQYEIHRLAGPDRIYLDFHASKLDPKLAGRKFQIQDSLLRTIRVAEREENITRVTLVTHRFSGYSITPAPNAHGLLIELRNAPRQN